MLTPRRPEQHWPSRPLNTNLYISKGGPPLVVALHTGVLCACARKSLCKCLSYVWVGWIFTYIDLWQTVYTLLTVCTGVSFWDFYCKDACTLKGYLHWFSYKSIFICQNNCDRMGSPMLFIYFEANFFFGKEFAILTEFGYFYVQCKNLMSFITRKKWEICIISSKTWTWLEIGLHMSNFLLIIISFRDSIYK